MRSVRIPIRGRQPMRRVARSCPASPIAFRPTATPTGARSIRSTLFPRSKRMSFAKWALAVVAVLVGLSSPATAALRVDVTQGTAQPLPIAIPDFVGGAPQQASPGANIAGVVRADLERSGLFRPLDPKSFIEQVTNINVQPNFANWR